MNTLEVAASHSVIPRMFSGNSLAAEIHLQIFLVSPFCFCSGQLLLGLLVFKDYKERSTEGRESGESAIAVINLDFVWSALEKFKRDGVERRGSAAVSSFLYLKH